MHARSYSVSFEKWRQWPFLLCYPPFSGLILPNFLGIGQSYFVHPQTVLQISIPFQRSYLGRQADYLVIS